MTPVDWLRPLGPIIILIVLLGGLYAIVRYKLGKGHSISLHISTAPQLYWTMAILLSLGGSLFYCFLGFWLIPYYALHWTGYILLIVSLIAQFGMAWIPDSLTNKKLHILHFTCGGTVAVCMILFLCLLCISIKQLPIISSILVIMDTILSIIYLVLFIFTQSSRTNFLFYESFFIGLFALTICALAFAL